MENSNENKIAKAILNGNETIVIEGKTIKLPEPQTAGTEYQKKFYAEYKAREIINNLS